jgi:hypothetical protein
MTFLPEGPPQGSTRRREVSRGWLGGSPLGPSSSTAAHLAISQGAVVLGGISGRVLNTVEIAPRCNIAICEFHVSFRGTPAY